MRRLVCAAAVLLLAALILGGLTGCSSSTSGSGTTTPTSGGTSSSATVTIEGFAFNPASVEVAVGGSVTWTNKDSATHDVSGDGGIESGPLSQGGTYSKTFDTAGTFAYKCSIHPTMTGTVVVK